MKRSAHGLLTRKQYEARKRAQATPLWQGLLMWLGGTIVFLAIPVLIGLLLYGLESL